MERFNIIPIDRGSGLGATLPHFVSQETLLRAGFNHYEATGGVEGKSSAVLYEGRLGQDRFIIIRNTRSQKDGTHVDWYFGMFKINPFLVKDEKEKEEGKNISSIFTRNNRVPGYKLEGLLKQAVKKHLGID